MTVVSRPELAALVSNMNSPHRMGMPLADLRARLEGLDALPVLPETGRRATELLADPKAEIEAMVALVASDPNLAAQVLRWANSPLYARAVAVDNLQDAVVRLGRDTVLNLALAKTASATLNIRSEGVLGSRALWREAILTANLACALDRQLGGSRTRAGVIYLSGLLHNLGLFLLGHEYPAEYELLRRVATANPSIDLVRIENLTIGVNHVLIGSWLLTEWSLPDPVVVAVREQRNPGYNGNHAAIAGVICLAKGLLVEEKWVQNSRCNGVDEAMQRLGCDRATAIAALAEMAAQIDAFDALVASLNGG